MASRIFSLKIFFHKKLKRKFSTLDRETIAAFYLKGTGIEIGAMDMPLYVPSKIKVQYLDRICKDEQIKIFKNLNIKKLKDPDIIDDCETMNKIENNTYDFIIANHVIEHLENPILAIENWIRVLKKDGVIFLAVPDMRYTFDKKRELTTNDHLLTDYKQGILSSREDHYYDFVINTSWGEGKSHDEILSQIEYLKSINFSIHYHVWDHIEFLNLIYFLKNNMNFPIDLVFASRLNYTNENIYIVKKA